MLTRYTIDNQLYGIYYFIAAQPYANHKHNETCHRKPAVNGIRTDLYLLLVFDSQAPR